MFFKIKYIQYHNRIFLEGYTGDINNCPHGELKGEHWARRTNFLFNMLLYVCCLKKTNLYHITY